MKLWCLFIIFLIVTISISSGYSNEYNTKFILTRNIEEIPLNIESSSFMTEDRIISKRSQRNANILYRYCRHSGQAPQFCLKYAVQMIYATGH